jgi:hypothetical protein
MYSFAQREDCNVLDEPFYGYYLSHGAISIEHPGQQQIVRTMERDLAAIVSGIESLAQLKLVFVKGMAHHILEDSPAFLLPWSNIILIRHPEKLVASFARVVENPSLEDIGLRKAAQLYRFLNDHGRPPLVIDSDELLKNPENYLRKLCGHLQIPFTEKMLHWNKGGIPEDGLWAQYWYANVHNSEGFIAKGNTSEEPIQLPKPLQQLVADALPYYNSLRKHILLNQ